MVAETLVLCAFVALAIGAFLLLNSALVFNTTRYMAVAPDALWRDKNYIRRLPNIVEHLSQAGFTSPWPARPTAFAALIFRRKLERALKHAFPEVERLVEQHLGLWAFLQLHRAELQALVRHRQMQRASDMLAESLDADERLKVLTFLNQCKASCKRANRAAHPPHSAADSLHWLARLQVLDVILREHGYSVSEELSALGHWDAADNDVILHEISLSQR